MSSFQMARSTSTTVQGPGHGPPRGAGRGPGGGRGNAARLEQLRRRNQEVAAPTPATTEEAPAQEAPATEVPATEAPAPEAPAQGELAAATPGDRIRAELETAAVGGLPDLSTVGADLRGRVDTAVRSAVAAAWAAALDAERRAQNPGGIPEGWVDTEAVLTAARGRYTGGPGIAATRFRDYLAEAQTALEVPASTVDDAVVTRALEILSIRCGRSVRTYTDIQTNPNIELATVHPSGVDDDAHAADNIQQVVEGRLLARSDYGNAPGGHTPANDTMLQALAAIAAPPHNYRVRVSELAGASHSRGSAHYDAQAIDIDMVNGEAVSASNDAVDGLMQAFRDLGATLVLGPGDSGHGGHVHAQW